MHCLRTHSVPTVLSYSWIMIQAYNMVIYDTSKIHVGVQVGGPIETWLPGGWNRLAVNLICKSLCFAHHKPYSYKSNRSRWNVWSHYLGLLCGCLSWPLAGEDGTGSSDSRLRES